LEAESSDPFLGKPWAIASLAYVTAYGWFAVTVLPLQIFEYIGAYHLEEWSAAVLAAIEVIALAITALAVTPSIAFRNKRAMCAGGCIATTVANLLSLLPMPWYVLLVTRIIAGAGFGVVVASTNALPVLSRQSAHLFALGQLALCLFNALIFFLLPLAIEPFGLHGLFLFEAGTALVTAAVSMGLPKGLLVRSSRRLQSMPRNGKVIGALASTFLYFHAEILLWSFAVQSGAAHGLKASEVDSALAWGSGIGTFGALAAVFIGLRWKLKAPLVIGYSVTGLLGLFMYLPGSQRAFTLAVLAICFFIVYVTPYILEVLAQLDAEGRVASAGGALINFGSGFAPLMAGGLAHEFGYASIGYLSFGLFVVGLVLIGPAAGLSPRSSAIPNEILDVPEQS
jgi:predicted MFS family arabinose efflux permease